VGAAHLLARRGRQAGRGAAGRRRRVVRQLLPQCGC
jgi:hypothetical protein